MIKNILKSASIFDLPPTLVKRVFFASAVFVMLFLLLFKPFQLYRSTTIDLLGVSALTGLYLFFVAYGTFCAAKKLITRKKVKKEHYLLLELLMSLTILTLVSLVVFFTRVVVADVPFTLQVFLQFLYYSFILSPFLVVIMRIVLLTRKLIQLSKAKAVSTASQKNEPPSDEIIFIPVSSGNETISFLLDNFVYAYSEGNYIHLYQIKNDELHRTIIRCTLSIFVKQFEQIEYCQRCHRSYFVNTKMVTRSIREKDSTKLILLNEKASIPVSRANTKIIKTRLNNQQQAI